MDDRHFTTSMTFNGFEELLPRSKFIRVHRSFIINKSKVRIIEGNRIVIGTIEIPIGSHYRDQFLLAMGIK
jgi:DNA-binding LytR/AlgR family response regulator